MATLTPVEKYRLSRPEVLSRLLADPKLSPAGAEVVRRLAGHAAAVHHLTQARDDELLVRKLFPPHFRRHARSLVGHLRRHGDDAPGRIEGMLRLAREMALVIDSARPNTPDTATSPDLQDIAGAPDDDVKRIAQWSAHSGITPNLVAIILGLLRRGVGDPRDHVRHVAAALRRNGDHARIWRKLLAPQADTDSGATHYAYSGDRGAPESYESTTRAYGPELAKIRALLAQEHGIRAPEH
jgi:hypothetical protein